MATEPEQLQSVLSNAEAAFARGLIASADASATTADGFIGSTGTHRTPGVAAIPADPGAQTWLDVWVDGTQMSSSAATNCEDNITHNQLVIKNPPSSYAVVPGSIAGASCTSQYGNTVVSAGG